MTLQITLPLPDNNLSPNNRASSRLAAVIKTKAIAKARRDAGYAAMHALSEAGIPAPRWEKAMCAMRFLYKRSSGRRPDPDNLVGWTKAVRDGFTDAGIWRDDRHVMVLVAEIGCDPADPRLVIEVSEVNGKADA